MNEEMEIIVLDPAGDSPSPVVDPAPVAPPVFSITEPEPEISTPPVVPESETPKAPETPETSVEITGEPESPDTEADAPVEVLEVVDTGSPNSDQILELLEVIQKDTAPHPFLTTDFSDYSVVEGLLLLIFLLLFLDFFPNLIRRWF